MGSASAGSGVSNGRSATTKWNGFGGRPAPYESLRSAAPLTRRPSERLVRGPVRPALLPEEPRPRLTGYPVAANTAVRLGQGSRHEDLLAPSAVRIFQEYVHHA